MVSNFANLTILAFLAPGVVSGNRYVPKPKRNLRSVSKKSNSPTHNMMTAQVVIGGAGFAGISAAQEFANAGVNFWIAEATDRLGGRMYGDTFGKAGGKTYHIEYGANWVQGLTDNPIWDMVNEYNLDGNLEDFQNAIIYDENGLLNAAESNFEPGSNCGDAAAALVALQELSFFCLGLGQHEPYLNHTIKQFCLSSLGDHFKPGKNIDVSCQQGEIVTTGFYPPNEPNPPLARLCQWYSLDFANLEPPELLSVKHTVPDHNSLVFGDANYFVRDKRGYKWLVESTGANFLSTITNDQSKIKFNDPRLNLNTKVVKVQWDPKGHSKVVVTLCQTQKVVLADSPLLYPCVTNKKYITVTANYFFSTFSVGVLKASLEAEKAGAYVDVKLTQDVAPVFTPPLSSVPALANAINTIGFSVFQKIFFQFPFGFWPDGVELFLTAYSKGKWVGDFAPAWLSLDLQNKTDTRYFPGSNILVLVVVAERAIEISSLSDNDIIAETLPVLNLMFAEQIQAANGGKLLTSSDILDFHLYRWYADPLFRGAYSTDIVHAPITALGDRYGNLVFSGEVTCHALNANVHGAYLSGKRSARLLLSQRLGVNGLNLTSICDV